MGLQELLQELKALRLPVEDYAIFGSGPLAVRGIRDCNDLDTVVSARLWEELSSRYAPTGKKIEIGNLEFWRDWMPWFSPAEVDGLIAGAEIIDGIPFVKLRYVIELKKKMGREKDKRDLVLIDNYLKTHPDEMP
ncbi:MAG TPA: hypothetical protein VJC21_03300 [Candidatus Nanoarchaeia archaeon]|nr:hypothetical protein [Candidatus Nanoarchaeia archaeon]